MTRRHFPMKVIRAARRRAGARCEAVGTDYGLSAGIRCTGDFAHGVEFDHVVPDQLGGEPTLENCAAICRACHRFKTDKVDAPRIAEAKRRWDADNGVKKPSRMAGARNSPFKRKIGGGVVPRHARGDA
ncbi:HNH endonuclease [Aureimonas leprariae]|uniref:HNH endonuclease n=1 Tax=Plantimonas leprariae TaxID=2615207 RepID=UPI001386C978|nr:HNH endonuclease signature motif containing protein [Aureimonas leprariae]